MTASELERLERAIKRLEAVAEQIRAGQEEIVATLSVQATLLDLLANAVIQLLGNKGQRGALSQPGAITVRVLQ